MRLLSKRGRLTCREPIWINRFIWKLIRPVMPRMRRTYSTIACRTLSIKYRKIKLMSKIRRHFTAWKKKYRVLMLSAQSNDTKTSKSGVIELSAHSYSTLSFKVMQTLRRLSRSKARNTILTWDLCIKQTLRQKINALKRSENIKSSTTSKGWRLDSCKTRKKCSDGLIPA